MKTSDDTLVKLINYLNKLYQEYKTSDYSNLATQLIKINTVLDFLSSNVSDKPVVYVLSTRHTDLVFISVFTTISELEDYVSASPRSIARLISSGKVKGAYTPHGYVSKIKIKDFVDRWFLKSIKNEFENET